MIRLFKYNKNTIIVGRAEKNCIFNKNKTRNMKNCPNCNAEVENDFNVCWNCNYSFSENRIINFDETPGNTQSRGISCVHCHIKMTFTGNFKFHEGTRLGFFGNLFELFVNRQSFDVYTCPKCGKVEFYLPRA